MNDKSSFVKPGPDARGQSSIARRFVSWFLIFFILASFLVTLQTLAKIPERMGQPNAHWLFGKQSAVYYIAIRLMLIFVVSIILSVVATISRREFRIRW